MKSRRIFVSARATDRIDTARAWLKALPAGGEALILGASVEAADDFVRAFTAEHGATFGANRLSLNRLIGLLAAEIAASTDFAFVTNLAAQAVAARCLFRLRGDPRVAWFASVIEQPGFPKAVAATRNALGHALIAPERLRAIAGPGAGLETIFGQFEEELRNARLFDRPQMIAAAIDALRGQAGRRYAALPILLLDVKVDSPLERDFIAALAAEAPSMIATLPAGDTRSEGFLAAALKLDDEGLERAQNPDPTCSLHRLQQHLFADTAPPEQPLDDSVALRSAAGEMQECVEVARRIQAEARRGVRFDQIAVLLHAPDRYGPYLEEALSRAGIPAWFAHSSSRPELGGRALLALLNCAAEHFSARRFAEYLSLAQLPDKDSASAEPSPGEFVPADAEFVPGELEAVAEDSTGEGTRDDGQPAIRAGDPLPFVRGTARAPWRWEQLLVDAAIVDGLERWEQRLRGLENELRLKRGELEDDDARVAALDRNLLDLAHLRDAALPIIEALASFPREGTWAEWLPHLRKLTEIAVRDRVETLRTLAELEPMGPVGPVTLDEVRLVLAERLGHLPSRPARRRYGAVFVAPTELARGFVFEVVMVPGLAERVFPRKLTEDPILPDAVRRRLDDSLALQSDRVQMERLALKVAVGAARSRIFFSYPRVDLDQARPRVPSFYALEIFRAAEGRLPGFDELARRASGEKITRLGWPVPDELGGAIDEIEFDLAVLDKLIDADPQVTTGAANYLLNANPHLGRALRARGRRWIRRWTPNDGLVDPDSEELGALARHQLSARSYSPTALQHFSACPYRFFLQAVIRLEPRDEITAIEVIDPLTRGAIFHEVQFKVLTALRERRMLPVTSSNLSDAHALLEEKLSDVAEEHREKLAPAIGRVWIDRIESIRADLREWMRRMATDESGFRPERFELAFGLTDRADADPASVEAPVALAEGINLRGSIDLVERSQSGALRVTDHKTGRVRAEKNVVIGGGKTLQPVLYALATEHLLKHGVESGRLYYCTAAGGYEERVVAIDAAARDSAASFVRTLGNALSAGFMPAAPGDRECEYCDYRRVCGPYEEIRLRHKIGASGTKTRLSELTKLREMR